MKATRGRVLGLALGLAVFTSVFVYSYLNNKASQPEQAAAAIEVVYASQPIAVGEVISIGMVDVKSLPSEMLPAGAFSRSDMVIGKVARADIRQDEPISRYLVRDPGGLTDMIPPGQRAVTVALDPIIGVGGFLQPGDRVDVIATFNINDGTLTKTVLQDVQLLATGSEMVTAEVDSATGKKVEPRSHPNATLAVSPSQAERLVLAESKGRLRLSLRGTDDYSIVTTSGTTSRSVVGHVPPDVAPERPRREPAAPPVEWHPIAGIEPMPLVKDRTEIGNIIQVVRGTKVEDVAVSKQ